MEDGKRKRQLHDTRQVVPLLEGKLDPTQTQYRKSYNYDVTALDERDLAYLGAIGRGEAHAWPYKFYQKPSISRMNSQDRFSTSIASPQFPVKHYCRRRRTGWLYACVLGGSAEPEAATITQDQTLCDEAYGTDYLRILRIAVAFSDSLSGFSGESFCGPDGMTGLIQNNSPQVVRVEIKVLQPANSLFSTEFVRDVRACACLRRRAVGRNH